MDIKTCQQCRKIFKKNVANPGVWKNRKFCSLKCFYNSLKNKKRILKEEWLIKHRETMKKRRGKPLSKIHKERIGLAHKGRKSPWVSKRNKQYKGSKSFNWKGGLSSINGRIRQAEEYKNWRRKVFKRDNYTCQKCKAMGYIQAHHIEAFIKLLRKYNIKTIKEAKKCKNLWNVNNGITLCLRCHKITNNFGNKKK